MRVVHSPAEAEADAILAAASAEVEALHARAEEAEARLDEEARYPDAEHEAVERRADQLENRLVALEADAAEARAAAEGVILRVAAAEHTAGSADRDAEQLASRLERADAAAAELEVAKARGDATIAVLRADLERAQRLLAQRGETVEQLVRERDVAAARAHRTPTGEAAPAPRARGRAEWMLGLALLASGGALVALALNGTLGGLI